MLNPCSIQNDTHNGRYVGSEEHSPGFDFFIFNKAFRLTASSASPSSPSSLRKLYNTHEIARLSESKTQMMKNLKNSVDHQLSLVSAPEDFPNHLRQLAALDSALRCPICKDFFQAPVIIHIPNCCHTFCSTCVRTCFNNNSNNKIGATGLGGVGNSQRCPVCKTQAQVEKIKPVPTLEIAVTCWQDARTEIFKMITEIQSLKLHLKDQSQISIESKDIQFNSPSPKVSQRDASQVGSPTHSQRKADKNTGAPTQIKPALKRKLKDSPKSELDSESEIEFLGSNPADPNALVNCPICQTQMLNSRMDAHVTQCLTGQRSSGKLSFGSLNKASGSVKGKKVLKRKTGDISEDKIPFPHFASLKSKELKAELKKHGLSTEGTLTAQTRRLSRYITLYNANLDSNLAYRKSREIIRAELLEWEQLQELDNSKRLKLTNEGTFAVEVFEGNRKKVITSEAEYLKKNQDQFTLLTAQAAKTFPTKKTQPNSCNQVDDNIINTKLPETPQEATAILSPIMSETKVDMNFFSSADS
ncbi:hypothetical protein O181_061851 [Austropuccinia psidii MF-1]|uniref:Postreplication repair E3 ubiquitin-protein ligase RAD18 n=1 Tax=Austropuccinia psidii MF-1 TaxID=1389203 RepID=A0A9Q3EGX8_9BASI|nr:hypothetical protein [Austropuccinia psidii MF-1]